MCVLFQSLPNALALTAPQTPFPTPKPEPLLRPLPGFESLGRSMNEHFKSALHIQMCLLGFQVSQREPLTQETWG